MTDLEILEAALAIVHPTTINARRKLRADDYWPRVALKAMELRRTLARNLADYPIEWQRKWLEEQIAQAETLEAAQHRRAVEAILAGERKPSQFDVEINL